MALISKQEKVRRYQSIQSVLGGCAVESLFVDDATQAILHQYAEGDLTLEQFADDMGQHARRLSRRRGQFVGAA